MRKDRIWDLLYPPRCPVCDRLLAPGEQGRVCEICEASGRPKRVTAPFCMKCGKPLSDPQQEYCRDCRSRVPGFDQGRAALWYRGMEDSMYRFKNRGRQEYAAFYSWVLLPVLLSVQRIWQVQVLVPIPVHPSRQRMRGYNQAALLAEKLSAGTGIPVDESLLLRHRKTAYQRTLDDRERRENMKNAFLVSHKGQMRERILLVDDIYTTGSTMDAAAHTLKKAGAGQVYCLSVCIGKGY